MEVDIKFDDGLWECQVTASSFESQDALASKPARLVVRGKIGNKMIFSILYHIIVYPLLSNLLFFSWRNECPLCDQWPKSHLRIKFLCFLRHLLQIAKPPIPICIRGQNIGNAATEIWDFPIINSNFPRNICKMLF